MKEKIYDIIIIGGGPIGLACGLEAKKAGLTYMILEKGALVNSLYNYPVNMMFFSTSERLEIGNVPFVSNNPKPVRNEALEYYRRVAASSGLYIKLFENRLPVAVNGPFCHSHFRCNLSVSKVTAGQLYEPQFPGRKSSVFLLLFPQD